MHKSHRKLRKEKKSYEPKPKQPRENFSITQIKTRGPNQHIYLQSIIDYDIVFGIGPAGVGKTMIPTAIAMDQLLKGEVSKIIITRPIREAGENMGFLPGGLDEKMDPYMRPIFDFLSRFVHFQTLKTFLEQKIIEIAPLAFMRGRTFEDCFIILDEAQNTTVEQMKMFLTRIGHGSKVVITGDPGQTDIRTMNGLEDAQNRLGHIEDISFCYFTEADIVRHPLVGRIVNAYEGKPDAVETASNYTTQDRNQELHTPESEDGSEEKVGSNT